MVACAACRKPVWSPPATPVDTHVRCRIPGEMADELLVVRERFPRVATLARMARDLGTSERIVGVWLQWGHERRQERRKGLAA